MTPNSSEPKDKPHRSLFGRSISARAAPDEHPETTTAAITPLPELDALQLRAAVRGITAGRAALAAALPISQEDLAASLVPLALARIRIEARWRPLGWRTPEDAVTPLPGGEVLHSGLADPANDASDS